MFYWNHRGTYVILTDAEELALVRQLSDDPGDMLDYHTSPEGRRKFEKRIFAYLNDSLNAQPEEFRQRYVFRSWYGTDAQELFPTFLDAYGRATRLATFGDWGADPLLDDSVEAIVHAGVKVYHVTLLARPWWLPTRCRSMGRISFPAASIEKLAGEVCNFVLMTDTFSLRFGRDHIRMSVR